MTDALVCHLRLKGNGWVSLADWHDRAVVLLWGRRTEDGVPVRVVGVARGAQVLRIGTNVVRDVAAHVPLVGCLTVAHVENALECLDGVLGYQAVANIHFAGSELVVTVGEHATDFVRALSRLDVVAARLGLVSLCKHMAFLAASCCRGVCTLTGAVVMVVVVVVIAGLHSGCVVKVACSAQ